MHELTLFPHRFLSVVLLGMFLNAVIGKMHKSVVDVVEGILIVRKTEVTFLVEPYFGRIEVLD